MSQHRDSLGEDVFGKSWNTGVDSVNDPGVMNTHTIHTGSEKDDFTVKLLPEKIRQSENLS